MTNNLQASCLIVCLTYLLVLVCEKTAVLYLKNKTTFFAICRHL